ncbi:MAG: protein-L-isoaspartate(D-aspartate) O-methyltransferase [Pirellulales bacterium]
MLTDEQFAALRRRMVRQQLAARGIADSRVLDAMARVPRHRFVPADLQAFAYDDHPLPLPDGQTISQPYIVALMTELAAPQPTSRVLEIGYGSGYQTAILAELAAHVWGLEIVPSLAAATPPLLQALGYRNVTLRLGDGYTGWPEHAPFDIILVAAAPPAVPPALVDQLATGGRLILPVGDLEQRLTLVQRLDDGSLDVRVIAPVSFVPMTGAARSRLAP